MAESPDPDELAERVADLEVALREIQTELQDEQVSRGPRLPSPRDILRVTDQHAIPGIIALLEAHIHALRILQRTIRMIDGGQVASDQSREVSTSLQRATNSLSEQLDRLVQDLDRARTTTDRSGLESLIDEAREIRNELAAVSSPESPDETTDASAEPDPDETDDSPSIDVEEELRSIRSEVDEGAENDDEDGGDDDPTEAG